MILFISGPFGVGKTSVVKVIVEKTPNAMVYYPEVIGSALRGGSRPCQEGERF
jgi:nucleoside-triphosphatase THEP1